MTFTHYLINNIPGDDQKAFFKLFSNVGFIFRRVASPIEGESSASYQ